MAGTRPGTARGGGSWRTLGATDPAFRDQAFQGRAGGDAQQSGDRNTSLGDDYFLSASDSIQPFTQMGPQVAHGYIHSHFVHLTIYEMYNRVRVDPVPHGG